MKEIIREIGMQSSDTQWCIIVIVFITFWGIIQIIKAIR